MAKLLFAFADTLFKADFKMDTAQEGIIWVQKIEDPRACGVVKVNEQNVITDFVEKPQEFVSDLAIIGIYYFRDGANLRKELQYLLDNNIRDKGEFQLTNALENMKQKGVKFAPGKVTEWLDCGNKDATVYTNQRVLEFLRGDATLRGKNIQLDNAVIVEPCFIGDNVAPATVARVVALAQRGHYNGLTFHRVEPTFVLQGGSPGANEYMGDGPYMRDEPGVAHTRGTIGISTRGRDTGDAQIFVNLVDSPRLDHAYTVFAVVERGMDVADRVVEGDVMARVELVDAPRR